MSETLKDYDTVRLVEANSESRLLTLLVRRTPGSGLTPSNFNRVAHRFSFVLQHLRPSSRQLSSIFILHLLSIFFLAKRACLVVISTLSICNPLLPPRVCRPKDANFGYKSGKWGLAVSI